jgi:hypothetical protein
MQADRRDAYCAVLGVRPNAKLADLQRAYRDLALLYHPDRNPGPNAARTFKVIQEAYEALTQPEQLPWMGLYHTPWSAFLTTRYASKSKRNNLLYASSGLFAPLTAVATVIYVMILLACFFITMASSSSESDYDIGDILSIIVCAISIIYGLALTFIFLLLAKR